MEERVQKGEKSQGGKDEGRKKTRRDIAKKRGGVKRTLVEEDGHLSYSSEELQGEELKGREGVEGGREGPKKRKNTRGGRVSFIEEHETRKDIGLRTCPI